MKNQGLPVQERGSAVVWILIMIALLAALSVALTQGSRSSLGSLDREQSDLAASEIIGYGQSLREAARMLKIKGCTDNYINFESAVLGPSFTNPLAPTDDSCDVFSGTGGGISYDKPQKEWLDINHATQAHWGQWFATGVTHIIGVGTEGNAGPGCLVAGTSDCKELIMGLPYIPLNVCRAINRKLGFGGATDGTPPKDSGSSFAATASTPFVGVYSTTGSEMGTATPTYRSSLAGCIEGDTDPAAGTYHFFQVLLAR
jgi:hypothetical protein